jgi:cysteine desulfurase/selenocysteine lyase
MPAESVQARADFDPVAIRRDFRILDQTVHRRKPLVYLDNAASSQRPRQVLQAMNDCYEHSYANVHRGTHWLSEEASRLYEEARHRVQRFIGARWSEEVIFTSGTTAGINTVARSWGDAHIQPDDEILLTLMEHHSNIVPWQQLASRTGATIRWASITADGRLDREDFRSCLNSRTRLVALSAVSNTLGTVNPVRELVAEAHDAGALVAVDAAQHVPHAAMDVTDWDADFVTFSGHKMLGPSGIGILYGKRDLLQSMQPFLGGGSMIKTVTIDGFTPGDLPARFEAGTPAIAESVGLAAAIDYLQAIGMEPLARHEQQLAAAAQERLREIPGLRILGPAAEHTCGIVSFVVEGVSAQDISVLLDLQGVAIRAGHHCTMPLHEHLEIPASCRASFYLYNTQDEVHRFADILGEILPRLR